MSKIYNRLCGPHKQRGYLGVGNRRAIGVETPTLYELVRRTFNHGRDGALYLPATTAANFETSTGTIPATDVTDPVGLQLDQRFGMALGPELVAPYDLSAWTDVASVTSKTATTFSTSGNGGIWKNYSLVPGKAYRIRIIGSTTSLLTVRNNTDTTGFSVNGSFDQEATIVWGAGTWIYFNTPAAANVVLSSISFKLLDGNHSLQATAAARPAWSNRVNLANNSEDVGAAAPWNAANYTITADNLVCGFNGPAYLDKLTATAVPSATLYETTFPYGPHTVSFYVDGGTRTTLNFLVRNNTTATNLFTGSFTTATGNVTGGFSSTHITGNIYRISIAISSGFTVGDVLLIYYGATGAITEGLYWYASGMQIETGLIATRYQRVTTATDFDTAGFPYYLNSDGINDSYTSATGGGGSAGFFWCGAIMPTGGAGTMRALWSDVSGAANGYVLYITSANKAVLYVGNGAVFTTVSTVESINVGTLYLITAWEDGVNLNIQLNANTVVQIARPVVVAGSAGFTRFKNNGAASGLVIGNEYASVYWKDTAGTAAERAAVQALVRAAAGL